MRNFDEALATVLSHAKVLETEKVALGHAVGRTLAKAVIAATDQPPFDGSAMDGYAVKHRDVGAGVTLKMIGASQAGSGFSGNIESGQCVRIFTGAAMPAGADAVVMQEKVSAINDQISFSEPVKAGRNVRELGLDFRHGDVLLKRGAVISAAGIALIAAANIADVDVFKRPVLAILATGNELVKPGSDLKEGQIVASNSYALTALFEPFAERVDNLGQCCDDQKLLAKAFQSALDGPADIIVSTGGASVGDHDLVLPVLKSLGVEIVFWKIAMRPGKPIIFGTWRDKLIMALPGNPVSAHVGAITMVLPAIKTMSGMAEPETKVLRLPLASPLPANGERRHFKRCFINIVNGQSKIVPISQHDSSHLSSLAEADGIMIVPENSLALMAGDEIDVIPLW